MTASKPSRVMPASTRRWATAGLVSVLSAALLGLSPAPASADDAKKGHEIAARSDRSDRGFGDSRSEITMVLRNSAGAESKRVMQQMVLEVQDESVGDKNLILFESPRDIDGTALLSHAKILDPDDQWLFLPALKRVKRISSANKSGPFVGSEFSFEDFTAQELGKFSYVFLREEPCGSLRCDVVQRVPLYENSGYTKQISWIDQSAYQVRKLEFYDRGDTLMKTLNFEGYKEYAGGVWRAHSLKMVNHKNGKSTDLLFGPFEFKTGLDDGDFVKGKLKSLR